MGVWLALAGGVALFSYGLTLTGESIRQLTQGPLKNWLLLATRTVWSAGGLGIAATLLAGSSSAITVVTVGFVSAGLLTLPRALAVILGASLGTTLTVQLVSFNLVRFAPLLILAGVAAVFVQRFRRVPVGGYGLLLLGFGFIFYGMLVMTSTAGPLAGQPEVAGFFRGLSAIPFLPFLLAVAVTGLIQNSATTIALAISFSVHGVVTPLTGLEMVLGANVGSTAASVYTALMGSRAARRTAGAYVIMKSAGALAALAFISPVTAFLVHVDPNPGRVLANGHTLFNLINGLVFLPLTGPLARLVERRWPDTQPEPVSRLMDPKWLDTPARALTQTAREVGRMARLIERRMVAQLTRLVAKPEESLLRDLADAETEVDLLQHAVHAYLTRLPQAQLSPEDEDQHIRLMVLANHLEHLSDTMMKMGTTAEKLHGREFQWPEDLWRSVEPYLGALEAAYQRAVEALASDDETLARDVVQSQPDIRRQAEGLRYQVLNRPEDWNTGIITALLELLDDLTVLSDRIAALGRIVLGIL
jgi:phosphate:Na+ symporter